MPGLTRRILIWSLLLSVILALTFLLVSWLDPLPAQQLLAIRQQTHQAAVQLGRPSQVPEIEFGRANLPPYLGRGRSELLGWLLVLAGLGSLASWRLARPLEQDLGRLADDCQRLERGQPLQGELSGLTSDFAQILGELERQQGELNRATRAARQALHLRERLLSRSHQEFQQPLKTMHGSLEGLAEHPYLLVIRRNLETLLRLVEDLSSAHTELHLQTVRAESFLRRTLEGFPKRIRLLTGPDCQLELDELRTGQVLLNLVGNALKYSQSEVEVDWGEDWVEVRDFGPGMEESQIPELMREFRQQNPGQQEGVGLGLATAKRWMELQGGRLEIHSSPGKGTRARLCFTSDRKKSPVEPAGAEPA
ncbi:HAMP domain-containing histidine kinase [bacterium]|nr:HAMP domain-containing histidine kinase [bacterium]